MDIVQKSKFLLSLFFTEIVSENIVFRYLWKKTFIFSQKIEVLTRAKKWTFVNGVSPWISFQKSNFFYGRFSPKLYQKTSFLISWKEKNDFKRKKLQF